MAKFIKFYFVLYKFCSKFAINTYYIMQLQEINEKLKTFTLTEVQKAKVSLSVGVSIGTIRNYLKGKVPYVNISDAIRVIECIEKEKGFSN